MYKPWNSTDDDWEILNDIDEELIGASLPTEEMANQVSSLIAREVIKYLVRAKTRMDQEVEHLIGVISKHKLIAYKNGSYILMIDNANPEVYTEHRVEWGDDAVFTAQLAVDLHYNIVKGDR